MRLLKPFLITLAGLALVLLAVSALLPSRVMTSRWVMVHADQDSVIDAVHDVATWPQWNLLMEGSDPVPVKPSYAAGDTIGWHTAGSTSGHMTLEDWNEKGMSSILVMGDQRALHSGFSVEKRQADSVQVVWYLIEDLKWYPWEKVYGMMASDLKGPLMQKSLDQLKSRLEH
jgi:hypothetical protein